MSPTDGTFDGTFERPMEWLSSFSGIFLRQSECTLLCFFCNIIAAGRWSSFYCHWILHNRVALAVQGAEPSGRRTENGSSQRENTTLREYICALNCPNDSMYKYAFTDMSLSVFAFPPTQKVTGLSTRLKGGNSGYTRSPLASSEVHLDAYHSFVLWWNTFLSWST